MAKKVNKRANYDLGSGDPITYEKSRIQRKMNFLILRGPGLVQLEVNAENEAIKKLSIAQRFKVKFVQTKTAEETVKWLKDANTWSGGVVFHSGSLVDENQEVAKTIKKILIPVLPLKSPVSASSYLDALKTLIQKLPKKA